MAHASKFVRPGSVRIGSNETEGLSNVAFKVPGGKKVLIVSNTSQQKQIFTIRYKGKTATLSLSAGSVATYIWD
jgi:glucosylceramidase